MSYAEQLKRDGHLLNRPPRPPKKRYDFSKKKSEWKAPLKRTRLKKFSVKREGANREYLMRRRVFLRANPMCQAFETIVNYGPLFPETGLPGRPRTIPRSTEIHHTKKPKCKYLNDESTWLAVCRWSHDWIEDHKDQARSLGLLC